MNALTATQYIETSLLRGQVLEDFIRRYFAQIVTPLGKLLAGTATVEEASRPIDASALHYASVLCGDRIMSGFAPDDQFHLRDLPHQVASALGLDFEPVVVLDVYREAFEAFAKALYLAMRDAKDDADLEAQIGDLVRSAFVLLGGKLDEHRF